MSSPPTAGSCVPSPLCTARRSGFTLAEMLVAIVVITLVTTIVLPAFLRQIQHAHTSAVVQDLMNVRTGIQTFQVDLAPRTPRELEDLANPVTEVDLDMYGNAFSAAVVRRWKGPYVNKLIAEGIGDVAAFDTGFDAEVRNRLVFFNSSFNAIASSAETADWIAVVVDGMTGDQFELINAYLEGTEPPGFDPGQSWTSGFLRWDPGLVIDPGLELSPVYFLAVPVR